MRPRGRKIAIIAAVVFFLNFQRLGSEITLRNFMFKRERMIEDFAQESENLLFPTSLPLYMRRNPWNTVKNRRGPPRADTCLLF